MFRIYGENFFHYAEYETGSTGTVCADIFKDGLNQVIVEQNCTGDVKIVSANMQTPKSSCSSGEGAGQVITFVVPGKSRGRAQFSHYFGAAF